MRTVWEMGPAFKIDVTDETECYYCKKREGKDGDWALVCLWHKLTYAANTPDTVRFMCRNCLEEYIVPAIRELEENRA